MTKAVWLDLIKMVIAVLIPIILPEAPQEAVNDVLIWIASLLLGGDGLVRLARSVKNK